MQKYIGFIFGPNGSGKGTLAKKLAEENDYTYISNGRVIRDWAEANNRKDLLEMIDEGEFIDDKTVSHILEEKFKTISHNQKLLIEGVPRKASQVSFIAELSKKYNFKPLWVIVLHAPLEVLIDRVKDRVFAPDGHVYHMTLNPPPKKYKLSELYTRLDDRPEIVRKRFEYYITHTLECVSDEYFLNAQIKTIDATKPISDVFEEGRHFIKEVEKLMHDSAFSS